MPSCAARCFSGSKHRDDTAPSSGAVYVFRRGSGGWAQETYIKASNPDSDDQFGTSVALRNGWLAVGATGEDGLDTGLYGDQGNRAAITNSGAVYLFGRETAWKQMAYIKSSNAGAYDFFGRSVALSDEMLVVGAPGEASGINGDQADNSVPFSGAVYVY